MKGNRPCLEFSESLVSARKRNNHNKKPVSDFEKDKMVVGITGTKMLIERLKRKSKSR